MYYLCTCVFLHKKNYKYGVGYTFSFMVRNNVVRKEPNYTDACFNECGFHKFAISNNLQKGIMLSVEGIEDFF